MNINFNQETAPASEPSEEEFGGLDLGGEAAPALEMSGEEELPSMNDIGMNFADSAEF